MLPGRDNQTALQTLGKVLLVQPLGEGLVLRLVESEAVGREYPLDVLGDSAGAGDRGDHSVVGAAAKGLEVLYEDGSGAGQADGVEDGIVGAVGLEGSDDFGGGLLVVDDGDGPERPHKVLVT